MYDHSRRTLMIASLAVLATFLDTTILFVAFPDITATFSGTSPSELSWVLNAYTIVFAAVLIPAGKLADRIGHRKVFLAGSTVFTAASMACGLAPTAELLIVFRIVQAVGAAALIPSSLAPGTQIPSVLGVVLIAGAAGLLSYGVVGSEDHGWLSAQTLGALGAGLVVLGIFVLHQQRTRAPALDLELFRIPN